MKPVFGYEYTHGTHLLVTGEDAADFLQSQFSNDLRPFEVGQCVYGLWLDVKGKVIADSLIFCEETERFRILSENSESAKIKLKLEQHIIADDVLLQELPCGGALSLIGSDVGNVIKSLGMDLPTANRFVNASGLLVYPGRRSQEPSFELWADSSILITDLKARLIELGVEFITIEQVQLARIAAGIPSVPNEIGPGDLPGEGPFIGDGVSLTKGCYLGQEVVSRMYNIGQPQRALFRVSGLGRAPACPIELYNRESKKIGELRSAFDSGNNWQGVALLKTRYATVGEQLNYNAGTAQIEDLFTALR